MKLEHLQVDQFRCFAQAEFVPAPGFNLVTGANGSGKTSLLEALHLLAHGRSFRGRVRDGLIRRGQPALEVVARWRTPEGLPRRAGLRHTGSQWQARLDGETVQQIGQLVAAVAVISFEPDSHALVDGGSEARRRFLDWGLFHVEPDFMPPWRRYSRALKQRNALLRQRGPGPLLDGWEQEMAQSGELLTRLRDAQVASLQPLLERHVAELLPDAGAPEIQLHPGWRQREVDLGDALLLARERDLALGHTSVGPHRADLKLTLDGLTIAGLSRGQTKQMALALMLAQASRLAEASGQWPVLQLDDLGAELDHAHQERAVAVLARTGAQVLITGTEPPAVLGNPSLEVARFHVEQNRIERRT